VAKPFVAITAYRTGKGIEYKVECANNVNSDELAHYLDEIIEESAHGTLAFVKKQSEPS